MLKYTLLAIGAAVFIAGYHFMERKRESLNSFRILALVAYLGLCMIIWACGEIADPLFAMLAGSWASMAKLAAEVAAFVIGAERILKPAFEDRKDEDTPKTKITPMGTSRTAESHKKNGGAKSAKKKRGGSQVKYRYNKK